MKCDKCGSKNITYYKQQRKDKMWIVTARCENDHHPVTGKPFYSIAKFDLSKLPILGSETPQEISTPKPNPKQSEFRNIMDMLEHIRARCDYLFPNINTFKRAGQKP